MRRIRRQAPDYRCKYLSQVVLTVLLPGAGFTLVEVAACLVIVGLLVSMVTVSLSGVRQIHELNDVVNRLQTLDKQARVHARRFDRETRLVFDMDNQGVESRLGQESYATIQETTRWDVPAGFELTGVRIKGSQQGWADHEVEVPFTTGGYSPTYSLHLSGQNGEERFLIFAGLSGHMWSSDSKEQVDAVFSLLEQWPSS
ncbi:MAG: prepilin-type N-terminal cleavage/methylation domain-containing protein [Phycisphaeraceae bacterium]|nr:prepilin-type N-terminal cleavage/methylation domain-containing protein [Phycisphaeraceae bacterium]